MTSPGSSEDVWGMLAPDGSWIASQAEEAGASGGGAKVYLRSLIVEYLFLVDAYISICL